MAEEQAQGTRQDIISALFVPHKAEWGRSYDKQITGR